MSFSWYEKEVKYKMNDYKVVNGIGRYWNEDSGKWVGNKIKYEIEEKYRRYNSIQFIRWVHGLHNIQYD